MNQMNQKIKDHQNNLDSFIKDLDQLKGKFEENDLKEKEWMAQNDTNMKKVVEK